MHDDEEIDWGVPRRWGEEGGIFGDDLAGPPSYTSTIYEAEGPTVILAVEGGWQKHEGKWSIGFGPKVIVYKPTGPVRKNKSDFDEKPVSGDESTGRTGVVQRRTTR